MLILVRHGQTAANAHGLLLGRSDPSLNETGRRQACALAAVLPRPVRLVSSPLLRARQTALELANAGLGSQAVEIDPRWIEMDYGDIEGHPPAVLPEDTWRTWWRDPHFVPAGGESVAAVGARVREACAELAREAAHADVIVVSHVSPIKAALAWALGVGDEVAWRMYLLDAAVCRVDTSGPHPLLLAFNEVHAAAEVVPDSEPSRRQLRGRSRT
ncbi:MAG TPA: histidine phosphatase family protein [Pseudonocardiaceae bacterium]|nr:histidine phosphatase family protein [Pseudonocardiaceae bacterium]